MTISGHKTRSLLDRYNIVNEADLRDAMDRTQNYIREAAFSEKRPALMQAQMSRRPHCLVSRFKRGAFAVAQRAHHGEWML